MWIIIRAGLYIKIMGFFLSKLPGYRSVGTSGIVLDEH
jgi:hypothetical protein